MINKYNSKLSAFSAISAVHAYSKKQTQFVSFTAEHAAFAEQKGA